MIKPFSFTVKDYFFPNNKFGFSVYVGGKANIVSAAISREMELKFKTKFNPLELDALGTDANFITYEGTTYTFFWFNKVPIDVSSIVHETNHATFAALEHLVYKYDSRKLQDCELAPYIQEFYFSHIIKALKGRCELVF